MKYYVLLVFVMLTGLLFGQTMWDEALLIREYGKTENYKYSATTLDNEIVYVWSKMNSGINDIFAMKYDNEGNQLWGEEPIIVDNSSTGQMRPKIITTNDDCFIVVWEDCNIFPRRLKAQKLNSSGERLWQITGISCAEFYYNDELDPILLFPNDVGGAIIVWRDEETFAVSLDNNGLNQWGESASGINLGSLAYENNIDSDGFDGLIIIEDVSQENDDAISVSRIGASGEAMWAEAVELDYTGSYINYVKGIYNNNDGYYILSPAIDTVNVVCGTLVRKISLSGELDLLQKFIPLHEITFNLWALVGASINESGDLFVVNRTYNGTYLASEALLAYRLDQQLNHVWDEEGVLVGPSDNNNFGTCVESNDTGELFISVFDTDWDQEINQFSLYKVDAQGVLQTEEGGIAISQAVDTSSKPILKYDGNLFFSWMEIEDGYSSLKQQVFNDNMQMTLPEDYVIVKYVTPGGVDVLQRIATYPLSDSERSVVFWKDYNLTSPDRLLYQIINTDGSVELTENGVEIDIESEYDVIDFITAQNELGQICIVWTSRYGLDMTSRIIDSDGTLLASDEGIDVLGQVNPTTMKLSSYNNEFFLAWRTSNMSGSSRQVCATKTTGISQWAESVVVDSYYGSTNSTFGIAEMINNYCIVNAGEDIHNIHKIAEDGQIVTLQHLISGDNLKFSCDSANNLFYTWIYLQEELFIQGITDTNELFWTNPVLVSSQADYEYLNGLQYANIKVLDEVYVMWVQAVSNLITEVRAQKISLTGERMWGNQGVLLSTAGNISNYNLQNYFNYLQIGQTIGGNLFVSWAEGGDENRNYKLNLIRNDGTTLLDEDNIALTDDGINQFDLKSAYLTDNKVMLAWTQSFNDTYTLYAQTIDFTTVDNETNNTTPITMHLGQNYPNPFNPETNISFDVPKSGQVRLDVYNLKGQKVKTLVNDKYLAGRHTVVWNGRDDSNRQVASGIYFYRMKTATNTLTHKMILMK